MAKKRIIGNPTTTPYNPSDNLVDLVAFLRATPPFRNPSDYEGTLTLSARKKDGTLINIELGENTYIVTNTYVKNQIADALSGGNGGSNITVDSELSTISTNPVQNKVVTEALQNLEPFVVEATLKRIVDEEWGEILSIYTTQDNEELGHFVINAYKSGKQIILKLNEENDSKTVHYSSECEWWEYGIIYWHIHIGQKCYTVALAAMEEDDDFGAFFTITTEDYATKSYVDTQIGDIETSLENIITKYGLGGDSV